MTDPNAAATGQTGWHRLLGKVLEMLLTPVGITVQTEVPITSEPPRADILLLRRTGIVRPATCCWNSSTVSEWRGAGAGIGL